MLEHDEDDDHIHSRINQTPGHSGMLKDDYCHTCCHTVSSKSIGAVKHVLPLLQHFRFEIIQLQ